MVDSTMKNIVVVEFNDYHQETVFSWVYLFVVCLQCNVTVFSPNRFNAIEYCYNMLVSDSDKLRLSWKPQKSVMRQESSNVLSSADCVIFNTFYSNKAVFEKSQKPLLRWCEKEQKKVFMYVHRPEDLLDSPICTFLNQRTTLKPTLLFSCKHGLDWYNNQQKKNACAKICDLPKDWFFPVHVSPFQKAKVALETTNSQYASDFVIVGALTAARRNYEQVVKIVQEAENVSNRANSQRLIVAGKILHGSRSVKNRLKECDSGTCRIISDLPYGKLFDVVSQSKILLTCCQDERYCKNSLSGSILMALAVGVPFTSTRQLCDVYAEAFEKELFLDEKNAKTMSDEKVEEMTAVALQIRQEIIQRNSNLLKALLKGNEE